MLHSIFGKPVVNIPHRVEYNRWMSKLKTEEYEAIVDTINDYIDYKIQNGMQPVTAGWIPGTDWIGTVYEPLYHATGKSVLQAGFFFGLIVFDIMMNRQENWVCGRFFNNGKEIASLTYFIV